MSVLGELAALELDRAIAALRALWRQLKGDARVPLRSAFGPELLKPWLPNIVIVEANGPRFRVRLAGTAVVGFAGRDFADKFLDEIIRRSSTRSPSRPMSAPSAPVRRWKTIS